jgi:hypothetical protein
MKYKVWDKEKGEYWPQTFTLLELAASHRFPSNAAEFYEILPAISEPEEAASAALVVALRGMVLAFSPREQMVEEQPFELSVFGRAAQQVDKTMKGYALQLARAALARVDERKES